MKILPLSSPLTESFVTPSQASPFLIYFASSSMAQMQFSENKTSSPLKGFGFISRILHWIKKLFCCSQTNSKKTKAPQRQSEESKPDRFGEIPLRKKSPQERRRLRELRQSQPTAS